MYWKKIFLMGACVASLFACNQPAQKATIETALINQHPAWINQGNIYEVNIRQYTPEGTFKAFEKHVDRLKAMGVQTLWFMPINPIGVLDRKGSLGSYYAVQNYTAINPEFGSLQDWKDLVKHCHELGLKVIIDWVPNHTSADHSWLRNHPDFYVLDSITKKPISPFDWTDVRKLNYQNAQLQDTMIHEMKYWITETDIDGFRCDVAGEVPDAFWKKCIRTLKQTKNIFMLAEGDRKGLHESGFDATYAWADFAMLKKIAKGERKADALDSVIKNSDTTYPANALRMYFTSNHDENTWNKADYATMPGASHAPFAVLTQTIKNTIPLIYSGQEEPFLDSLSFFYKDTITFKQYARAPFYTTLLQLRKSSPALAMDAQFQKINTGNDQAIYGYLRVKDNHKLFVLLNLTNKSQTATIVDKALQVAAHNVFANTNENIPADPISLPAWGYLVYQIEQ